MLANMATSLIMHKRIKTTIAKAKALRTYVEPLLTKSKDDSTNSRRVVFSHLQSKEAVTELFRDVSPKIADRPGGYTRILKIGHRLGDSADMCYIELVDYNENLLGTKSDTGKTGKRKRRGSGKKKDEAESPVTKKTSKKTTVQKKDTPVEPSDTVETVTATKGEPPVEEVIEEVSDTAEQSGAETEHKENNTEEDKKE